MLNFVVERNNPVDNNLNDDKPADVCTYIYIAVYVYGSMYLYMCKQNIHFVIKRLR